MARILVTDDDDAVRAPLVRVLQIDGHVVDEARDGAEALDILTAPDSDHSMLVSDIRMPIMDGIALALAVAARKPGFPILLMTGYAEQRERAKELQGLVDDVLTKPFPLGEFRTAVKRILNARGLLTG